MTDSVDASSAENANAWRRFWNRGVWWKALLAAAAYLALYQVFGAFVLGPLVGKLVNPNIFANAQSVLIVLVLPILFGAVVLVAFVASLGWFGPLFGRQPIGGRGWMWVAVVLVLIPVVLRLVGIDYGAYDPAVIALTFAAGLLIGFTEELLTHGVAVKILRDAGHGELAVAVISSALFALLHSTNLLSGQPVVTVLVTIAFAFGFGMMMYLVLRVTGHLIWPIVLHAVTDPTTFLASGGIDVAAAKESVAVQLAGPFNIIFIFAAVVALFLIRGRVQPAAGLGRDPAGSDGW